ncbi:MAG: hypothetical protein QME51_03535 [Planctomycetota bacterium]|nr:hypothetical protein [Planctomycetota bacterium]MDI6787422.1 hypothetical protein [Planctomycetota bacterium]
MEQYELLQKLVNCFESLGIPYFITGSIASMAYGEPRLTNDIDVVAKIEPEQITELKRWFPESEFYLDTEAVKEALEHSSQFNIIHPASGLKIDVIISKNDDFDDSRFRRIRKLHTAEDSQGNFSSPEDVIIKKMDFYRQGGSEKHLRDIIGIIKISGDSLNFNYINQWVNRLNLQDIWQLVQK